MLDGQPAREFRIRQVADRRIVGELEITARHRQWLELRARQQFAEMVAFGFIECGKLFMVFGMLHQHFLQRPLRRGERAEGVVLVHLAELGAERGRCDAVTDLPAGAVIGLAEARNHKAALGEFRIAQHRFVARAVVNDVFVHLVGQQQDVRAAQDVGERGHVGGGEHRTGRVVWRVDHQHPRARGDRVAHFLPVHRKVAQIERHMHCARTGEIDCGLVAVVTRVEDDHFLARPHDAEHRVEDRLAAATGDGDLGVRIDVAAVDRPSLRGDRLAQR